MKYYLDSSVVLRKLLDQPNVLKEFPKIRQALSSSLLRLECLRTLDRMARIDRVTNEELAELRSRFFLLLDHISLIPLNESVLLKAEQSFPTPLGSLDSLHLATAMLLRQQQNESLIFATHDQQLALAAKAQGFKVVG